MKGDIILRGKVGGDPFEAKYPIDVRATGDAGNAFVPRLFAAARIADRERDATDAQKSELVALSRRFSVPSRFTSLLVLESEAMFKAFGIERADHGAQWTGEAAAQGSLVATLAPANGHGAGDLAGALGLRGRKVARQERPVRRRRGLLERALETEEKRRRTRAASASPASARVAEVGPRRGLRQRRGTSPGRQARGDDGRACVAAGEVRAARGRRRAVARSRRPATSAIRSRRRSVGVAAPASS